VSIATGTKVTLKAIGTYSDNSTADLTSKVTWVSLDPAASISVTGVVTGLTVGSAGITAALNGITTPVVVVTVSSSGGVLSAPNHLNVARYEQTANLISTGPDNGSVLVAGGFGVSGAAGVATALSSAEMYDPVNNIWKTIASLAVARGDHTSTQFTNGQILVVGGGNYPLYNDIASSELYDPVAAIWTTADNLLEGRSYHTSTLLADETVLVVGGGGYANDHLASAERYDPAINNGANKGTWKTTGPLNTGRYSHTATLFANSAQPFYGKVMVAGGFGGAATAISGTALSSVELYDPAAGTWKLTGSLNIARYQHTATLLSNGKILVVGGYDAQNNAVGEAELYDPATEKWTVTKSLSTPRAQHTATLLPNSKVLVMGGEVKTGVETKTTELYDPSTGTWTATADLLTVRDLFSATLLGNGKILVAGGTDESTSTIALDNSEVYQY
jgi:hypothetical protein